MKLSSCSSNSLRRAAMSNCDMKNPTAKPVQVSRSNGVNLECMSRLTKGGRCARSPVTFTGLFMFLRTLISCSPVSRSRNISTPLHASRRPISLHAKGAGCQSSTLSRIGILACYRVGVPAAHPSPLPRRKRRLQSALCLAEAGKCGLVNRHSVTYLPAGEPLPQASATRDPALLIQP